jgi:CobW/HypB/UreG, nucleotide-binding domain
MEPYRARPPVLVLRRRRFSGQAGDRRFRQQLRPFVGYCAMILLRGRRPGRRARRRHGERAKVVILSVTEGDDKPLKYPHMFKAAELMILNKMDLLPHVDFDPERAVANALQVNPSMSSIRLSARTGQGLEAWYEWLRHESARARDQAFS